MIISKIILILDDLRNIYSKEYFEPNRKKLLLAYLRIRLKVFVNRWFNFKKEHFLGFEISFPSYNIFFAIFRQIFIRRTYYFQAENNRPKILDCGGNIGMSVLYFKYLYPESEILVFEPSPEVLEHLRANVSKNKLNSVTIINSAVSDENSTTLIYPRGEASCGNTLDQNIFKSTKNKKIASPFQVNTVKLSDFVKKHIDLLKLDIEGLESVVLKELKKSGALDKIKECVMEYHYYPKSKNNLSEILNIAGSRGWQTQFYFEDTPAPEYQLQLAKNESYSFSLRLK